MTIHNLRSGDEVYYCQPGKEKIRCRVYELRIDEVHLEVVGTFILLLVPYSEVEPIPLTDEFLDRVSDSVTTSGGMWSFNDFYLEKDENSYVILTSKNLSPFKTINYRHELNHFIQEFNNEYSRS